MTLVNGTVVLSVLMALRNRDINEAYAELCKKQAVGVASAAKEAIDASVSSSVCSTSTDSCALTSNAVSTFSVTSYSIWETNMIAIVRRCNYNIEQYRKGKRRMPRGNMPTSRRTSQRGVTSDTPTSRRTSHWRVATVALVTATSRGHPDEHPEVARCPRI